MNNLFPKLPVADWIDSFVDWLTTTFEVLFDGVTAVLEFVVNVLVL